MMTEGNEIKRRNADIREVTLLIVSFFFSGQRLRRSGCPDFSPAMMVSCSLSGVSGGMNHGPRRTVVWGVLRAA